MAILRSRPTVSHIHYRLSPDLKLTIIYEACFDVLPKFMFEPGRGLAGKKAPHHAKHLTADGRIASFQFGCCLVQATAAGRTTTVLLDTGIGCIDMPPSIPADAKTVPLVTTLQSLGIEPAAIDLVVHTHLHNDHVGWNVVPGEDGAAPVPTFPNARHCVHREDWDYAQFPGCPWAELTRRKFGAIQEAGRLVLLEGDEGGLGAVAPQLSFVHTPGHTPGHLVVLLTPSGSPSPHAVYIGDAMHHSVQVERPEWSPHFDCCCWSGPRVTTAWTDAMRSSHSWTGAASEMQRRRLLRLLAAHDALLVSPHFAAPGIGAVRRIGGSSGDADGDGSGGGGGGGSGSSGGSFEYSVLVPLRTESAAESAASASGVVECRACDAWNDGDWAVRAACGGEGAAQSRGKDKDAGEGTARGKGKGKGKGKAVVAPEARGDAAVAPASAQASSSPLPLLPPPHLLVVDRDASFCAAAEAALAPLGQRGLARVVCADLSPALLDGVDCLVHGGNSAGLVVSGLDHALLALLGEQWIACVRRALHSSPVGELPVGTALLVETGAPFVPLLCYAPAFPHHPRAALDAARAALRAIAAHNAAAAREGGGGSGIGGGGGCRPIGRVAMCALGTYAGCTHQEEAANQMASAFAVGGPESQGGHEGGGGSSLSVHITS